MEIIEHKEIEGINKVKEFRDLEEYQVLSIEISPEDELLYLFDQFDWRPIFCGIGNAGKDITTIVH